MSHHVKPVLWSVLAFTVFAACGDDDGRTATGATGLGGITSATGLTTATTTTTATASTGDGSATAAPTTGEGASETGAAPTSDDATSGALPKLDVGGDLTSGGETTAGGAQMGCDKVDFLFVVDNSGSMAGEQMNLIASFPGFIDTITQTLEAQDFHIMAVSTDNGEGAGLMSKCTNGACTCTPAPLCCENACAGGLATTCNGFDCNNLPIDQCAHEYGTGQEFDADGNHCMLAGGRRYMLESQPDPGQTFACVANVGTYGSGDEKPMLAAIEACSEVRNGPGGCVEGFLRDDAILVLTFITDEEDDNADGDGSPGGPAEWYDAIVAAKNGDPKAVVVLGLLGDSNLPGGVCPANGDPNNNGDGAEDGLRLQSFVGMFPNGVVGSVCAPDYTPFFVDAVSVIDLACDTFEPPK